MKHIAVVNEGDLVFKNGNVPKINEDECLVKVKAIGINRADILQRQGKYPPPKGESEILGLEVAGIIEKCSPESSSWSIGDRVFALVSGGAYSEYVAVRYDQLFKLPKSFSYIQGAATAETFLTAYQSLFTIAGIKSKQSVLIHAGASGVGTAAIQLAKSLACYVVVTVSTAEKAKACLVLGADDAICYKTHDFVKWSKENRPQGFDVILDVVGGEYLEKNIQVAALDAHIVMLSMLGGRYAENIDIAKMLFKRVNIHASTLRNRTNAYKANLVSDFKSSFENKLDKSLIFPVLDTTFSWQEVEKAHQVLIENQNIGKVTLSID